MGFLSTILGAGALFGFAMYAAGRKGMVRFARSTGQMLGAYVARSRRSRARVQRTIVDSETPQQRETSMKLQRNLWELRMIMNEMSMVRSLSPRLLHRGNFGFTNEELMSAIGVRPEIAVQREKQLNSHMTR